MDDRIDAARDQAADDVEPGAWRGQGHGLQAGGDLLGAAGVEGGQKPTVAGVGRLEHVQHLPAADLADDDAVGAHAKGVADELAKRDLALALHIRWARLEPDDVWARQRELGDVLNGHDPLPRRDGGGEHVEECDIV